MRAARWPSLWVSPSNASRSRARSSRCRAGNGGPTRSVVPDGHVGLDEVQPPVHADGRSVARVVEGPHPVHAVRTREADRQKLHRQRDALPRWPASTPSALLGDGEQDAAVATAGVDVVVGLGDVVQRVTVADGDGEGADGGCGGEVAGGLALGLGGEVVAAEQSQGDVVEQQRPEGDLGAVRAGGVGGDDGVVGGDGVVEIGVVGQRDLDDPVDAPRRVRADGRGGAPASRATAWETTAGSTRSRSAVRRTVAITVAPPSGRAGRPGSRRRRGLRGPGPAGRRPGRRRRRCGGR